MTEEEIGIVEKKLMKKEKDNIFFTLTKKFENEVLKPTILPNGNLNSKSFRNSDTGTIPITFEIPSTNKLLQDSKYFYEGKKQLIHYTNLKALVSILREKGIRMYNLKNANDPKEYEFAANTLKLGKTQIDNIKNGVYILSMSELDPTYTEDPVLWRLFGYNGFGCAIVLEITNNLEEWHDFHLSKVYYDDKKDIDLFYKKSEEFQNDNPAHIKYDLSRLIGFHKADIWHIEKEVRILAYFKDLMDINTPKKSRVHPDINRKNEKVSYNFLSIDLNVDDDLSKHLYKTAPLIKIKEVIVGYNVSNFNEIKQTIAELGEQYLKYRIEVKQSCFIGRIK